MIVACRCIVISDGSLEMKKSNRQANDSKQCGDGASAPSSAHFVLLLARPLAFVHGCCAC